MLMEKKVLLKQHLIDTHKPNPLFFLSHIMDMVYNFLSLYQPLL